jgi:HEAT repeat protein
MMAVSPQLKALVEQMPNPDGRGMLTENIDKDKIEKAIAAIYQGGRENVQGLVEMLGAPGSDEDVKPHYALHTLANYTVIVKDEEARRQLCEVLTAALAGDHSTYVKAFLCQTLQWVGHRESVPALGKLLLDEELCDPAATALVAIKDGAAEPLRAALPQAGGRCRLTILHSLAALADAQSADIFKQALQDSDCEIRIAAGAGLARLGEAGSADALIEAAEVEPGWERIQATKHCLILAERLTAAGKKDVAAKIYTHLKKTRSDPSEAYIREAAEKALAGA